MQIKKKKDHGLPKEEEREEGYAFIAQKLCIATKLFMLSPWWILCTQIYMLKLNRIYGTGVKPKVNSLVLLAVLSLAMITCAIRVCWEFWSRPF